jgi:hypothetical protein
MLAVCTGKHGWRSPDDRRHHGGWPMSTPGSGTRWERAADSFRGSLWSAVCVPSGIGEPWSTARTCCSRRRAACDRSSAQGGRVVKTVGVIAHGP